LDCAFWDLEAKREGVRVWELIGLNEPKGLVTAYTLSIDSPDAMYRKAVENADRPLLKIKLGGEGDLERLAAVRQGAPDSEIIIDANEGWDLKKYVEMTRQLTSLGVTVVEQPLPAGVDSHLREIEHSLCICADEACHDRNSLKEITGKYDMVNIKLDKTGGLTEALELKRQAQAQGLKIMVGCMLGSSLAIAPAVVLAHDVEIVDLDGPLLLATDHAMPISYNRSKLQAPSAHLWG